MNNILLLFIIIILIVSIQQYLLTINEHFREGDTYSTDGELHKDLIDILNELNITPSENGTYFIPSDYNYCEKTIRELNVKYKYVFVMDGCDIIGSKIALWNVLRKTYGLHEATKYMPRTYLYSNNADMLELYDKMNEQYYNNKQMYILKNYEQRQEGLKIVNTWDEINDNNNKKQYYLIQQYLYNPLLIAKRKTNMRIYLLIVCNSIFNGYIYNDGFMYYTPNEYDEHSIDFDKHITTGYIDRQIYIDNPLTINDLRNYLGEDKSIILDTNIAQLMFKVCYALSSNVCNNIIGTNSVRFQIYGVDIAPLNDLSVQLMEINKGPDLGFKDERDKKVKRNMQIDIFKIVNPALGELTNFKKIY